MTRLRRLGGVASRRDLLAQLAQPLLSRARDDLAESVSLAVLDNDGALFIARAEAEHIVATGVRVGTRLPTYCSATGRVLLSQFSDKEVLKRIGRKPLARRTSHTLTTTSELLAEIRSVREKGYAISDEELELGLRALAVPVIGPNDEIIAAVSVSAASARVRSADLRFSESRLRLGTTETRWSRYSLNVLSVTNFPYWFPALQPRMGSIRFSVTSGNLLACAAVPDDGTTDFVVCLVNRQSRASEAPAFARHVHSRPVPRCWQRQLCCGRHAGPTRHQGADIIAVHAGIAKRPHARPFQAILHQFSRDMPQKRGFWPGQA